MTIVVNPINEQEEKVLIAFLDGLKYSYGVAEESIFLTDAQQEEILRRDKDFKGGKTTSRPLSEVLEELEECYKIIP